MVAMERVTATQWRIAPQGRMRVPAILYATEALVTALDAKVCTTLL